MQSNELPTLGLEKDFMVIRLPQAKYENRFKPNEDSFRLVNGAFIFGLSGRMSVSVNFVKYDVEANKLLTIIPHNIVQGHEISEDFEGYILLFTPSFAEDISFLRSNMSFMSKLHNNPMMNLSDDERSLFLDYCQFLTRIEAHPLTARSPEIRKSLLTSILFTIGGLYRNQMEMPVVEKQSRANYIFRQFLGLLSENYARNRSVAFYASKLCITPKYLGSICREVSSRLATDIIANAVILDAKAKLRNGSLTVQEISNSLNFPNASFFGRYFKRHTGLSPIQYRETL